MVDDDDEKPKSILDAYELADRFDPNREAGDRVVTALSISLHERQFEGSRLQAWPASALDRIDQEEFTEAAKRLNAIMQEEGASHVVAEELPDGRTCATLFFRPDENGGVRPPIKLSEEDLQAKPN